MLALRPKKGSDLSVEDYNDWYERDHVPLLSLSPGWLRSSRWVLRDESLVEGGKVEGKRGDMCPFLAAHEYESMDSFQSKEFKAAISSPWREKVVDMLENIESERRNFKPVGSIG